MSTMHDLYLTSIGVYWIPILEKGMNISSSDRTGGNAAPICTAAIDGAFRTHESGVCTGLQKIWAFIVDEDGPTAVEYAVMLSLIVAVCLSAITTVGSNASKVFSKVSSSL